MNKKIAFSVIVILLFLGGFMLYKNHGLLGRSTEVKESLPRGQAIYEKIPDLNQLKEDSDIIVEVNVTNDKKMRDYKGVSAAITTVKIKEVIKGNLDTDKLNILQDTNADVTITSGQRLLMFLRKGIDNPDCYIPVGGGQGIYEINNDELKLSPQSIENENILKDLKGNYSDVKSKLKK